MLIVQLEILEGVKFGKFGVLIAIDKIKISHFEPLCACSLAIYQNYQLQCMHGSNQREGGAKLLATLGGKKVHAINGDIHVRVKQTGNFHRGDIILGCRILQRVLQSIPSLLLLSSLGCQLQNLFRFFYILPCIFLPPNMADNLASPSR